MAIGAAVGALSNRNDPLKGAMLGAAGGATGGLLGPALGAAAGSAGGAATGAAAGTTAGTVAGAELGAAGGTAASAGASGMTGAGGLLTAPFEHMGAASSLGTNIGSQQTAQLAAQQAGMGESLLGNAGPMFDQMSTFAKPIMQGVQTAKSMEPPPQQMMMPSAPRMNSGPPDLNGLLALGQQKRDYNKQMSEMRRQSQQAAINRMLG